MAGLATMIITAIGNGVAITSMPVTDMQTCNQEMATYVSLLPGVNSINKSTNAIIATIPGSKFYLKCQERDN